MRLAFQTEYRSIKGQVSEDELPPFVLITGLNGAGKTQLLEALARDATHLLGADGNSIQATLLSMQPQFVGSADNHRELPDVGRQLFAALQGASQVSPEGEAGIPSEVTRTNFLRAMSAEGYTPDMVTTMEALITRPLETFDIYDCRMAAPILQPTATEMLQLPLPSLIHDYAQRIWANRVAGIHYGDGYRLNPTVPAAAIREYWGEPPWDSFDRVLRTLGLPYRVKPPPPADQMLHEGSLALLDLTTDSEVSVQELSSGEITILGIVVATYKAISRAAQSTSPGIILLDEPDQTLHPSMVEKMLEVIRSEFVTRQGLSVIMTTHSPTTVALAPLESIFIMRRAQTPRLIQARRAEALAALTVGIPGLEVRIENRRTVIVEGNDDEACYDKLFELLRQEQFLTSPYTLKFVAAGKGQPAERSGGSQAVVRLVKELRTQGNTSVWGIVDRDTRGGTPEGIFFADERYSLENLVLDPLMVGAYVLYKQSNMAEAFGLSPGTRPHRISSIEVQAVVDAVVQLVRPQAGDGDEGTADAEYVNGTRVRVPQWWFNMPGHQLMGAVRNSFPALGDHQRDSDLMRAVVNNAHADLPQFIPVAVQQLFNAILQEPVE